MEEPRARVVCNKANGHIIDADIATNRWANVNDITANGVLVVVGNAACAANNTKRVLQRKLACMKCLYQFETYAMKMEWMRATKSNR
jgi:hypothetical protein